MNAFVPSQNLLCFAVLALMTNGLHGQAPQRTSVELTEFSSKEGKFSILLPGKPQHEETTVGDAKEIQHQFQVGGSQGVYLISYQDNPNLRGSSPEQIKAALHTGRDSMQKGFGGKLIETKDIQFDKKHPGLNFRFSIPQAKGEARCRFTMVGTRLYQILVIGTPDFVSSKQATEIIDSFKLLR